MSEEPIGMSVMTGVRCPICGKEDCRGYNREGGGWLFVCPDCSKKHYRDMEDDHGQWVDCRTGNRTDARDSQ